jgi:hypothetical protein
VYSPRRLSILSRKNTAQSQKIELNDVVDTNRLSDQILEYLNERVKKGAPCDSKGPCSTFFSLSYA